MNTYSHVFLFLSAVLLVLHANRSNGMKGDKSYLDDIQLSYENGTWQCNQVLCPPETYGCRIERYTDPDYVGRIKNLNYCYVIENGTKIVTDSLRWVELITLPTKLEFFITSFLNSSNVCAYGCSLSSQFFNGTVNVTDWSSLQEDAKHNVEVVGEPIVRP